MTSEKFKRRTIRLSPIIDKELEIIAKKNHITVNKLVSELITYNINDLDKVDNTITISNILELLQTINNNIKDLQKNSYWLSELSKQIFVNSGFVKNLDIKNDKAFNDFISNRYKEKYEEKFNS